MRHITHTLLLAVGLLMAVVPALAHHSFSAEYDATKQITVKGKFTKMEWVNPHYEYIHTSIAPFTWTGAPI